MKRDRSIKAGQLRLLVRDRSNRFSIIFIDRFSTLSRERSGHAVRCQGTGQYFNRGGMKRDTGA
jgi:hypothetical protein